MLRRRTAATYPIPLPDVSTFHRARNFITTLRRVSFAAFIFAQLFRRTPRARLSLYVSFSLLSSFVLPLYIFHAIIFAGREITRARHTRVYFHFSSLTPPRSLAHTRHTAVYSGYLFEQQRSAHYTRHLFSRNDRASVAPAFVILAERESCN